MSDNEEYMQGWDCFLSCYIATNCYFDFNYTVTAEPNVTHLFTDRPKGS